ncbi:MAG: ornithine carbamoyltransferase [Planctomycetota bacterium]
MRHLLTLFDINSDELREILKLAADLKSALHEGLRQPVLSGRMLGMLFEKQSLRTRVSFESAIAHLGGSSIFLGQEAGWGKRETVADFGRVLSEYLDVLVFRGNDHGVLAELARHCSCPVINGLTPNAHPCQAIADVLTIEEHCPDSPDRKVVFVGDGNNVARSLALACAMMDTHCVVASPDGYGIDESFIQEVQTKCPGAQVELTNDPIAAVTNADAVYTDVWTSMGQESESEVRKQRFAEFQINAKLMSHAKPDAKFLHCLPARRGEEVTDEVIDGPNSVVVKQAGNRMHAQKAILVWLLRDF